MRKKRKVICLLILFTLTLFVFVFLLNNKLYAYSETGHEDFKKIVFVEDGNLLNTYKDYDINYAYSKLSRPCFGWKTKYFNVDKEAEYEGITIFSRSNKTTRPLEFEYVLKETEITETSVRVKGSVSAKITGTIKKINSSFGVEGEYEYEKKNNNSISSDAKTTISFSIPYKKKLTLIITGKCYVTNGVSRYTFFWITFQKGAWETIDVETIVYELREERI